MDDKPIHKTFEIKVLEQRKDGGRIVINTASVDRDRDRVMPGGAKVDNYLRNPVVQWGHNYRDPWATVGKTNSLNVSPDSIEVDFDLRPAANDHDPQNIVLLLWNGGWVNTSSIGFIPKAGKPNDVGGTDFSEWELLEWSLVPIPANQDALRLAIKGLADEGAGDVWDAAIARTILDKSLTIPAREAQLKVLTHWRAKMQEPIGKEADAEGDPGRAWIRRLSLESGFGKQTIYACFRKHTVDVPKDATLLQMDMVFGGCSEVPHPEAGKTVTFKDVTFIPPLEFVNQSFGKDAVIARTLRDCTDEDAVKAPGEQWDVLNLSDVVDALPMEKSLALQAPPGFDVDFLTRSGAEQATKFVKRLHETKRGRVLSAKNEGKIRQARDNLDEVLAEIEKPETEDEGKTIPAATPAAPLLDAAGERDLAESMRILLNTVKGEITK